MSKSVALTARLSVTVWLPQLRRTYVISIDVRGAISCWMPALRSQLYSRTFQPLRTLGSYVWKTTDLPKFWLAQAPHSPLTAGVIRSQSGVKLPRRGSPTGKVRSFQLRFVLVATRDAGCWSNPYAPYQLSAVGYRPRLNLSDVLPLPDRSYAAPNRGLMSFGLTPASCAGKVNATGRNLSTANWPSG